MSEASNGDDSLKHRGQQAMLARQREKQNAEAKPKRGAYFPMGYKEGFSQWWASISPMAAEHKVLSFIPYLQQAPTQQQTGRDPVPTSGALAAVNPNASASSAARTDDTSHSVTATADSSAADPHGRRRWHSTLVKLSGKDRALNEFSIERLGEDPDNHLVMLHGYGAGLGFFYKNFEPLSRAAHWRLYALDLLGMGRSSRPPFRLHAKDREGKIREAEDWFVDALEEWRVQRGIKRFTLLGHSLGGYMAVAYALKYPGHLNKLILASPVGVPEDPYAVNAEMPDASAPEDAGDKNNFLNQKSKADAEPRRRPMPKWLVYLWDANVSPFSFVRWSGPLGPRLVSGWTSRRFSQMPPAESAALHDYAYSLFRQRGSGEYALTYILAPGAFARSPLIRRIAGVGRQPIPEDAGKEAGSTLSGVDADKVRTLNKEHGIPVVFFYGEQDWMDTAGGYAAAEKIREATAKALQDKDSNGRDNGSAKVYIVPKAGHHVYLDGWEAFNGMMKEEMEDTERSEREARRTGQA